MAVESSSWGLLDGIYQFPGFNDSLVFVILDKIMINLGIRKVLPSSYLAVKPAICEAMCSCS